MVGISSSCFLSRTEENSLLQCERGELKVFLSSTLVMPFLWFACFPILCLQVWAEEESYPLLLERMQEGSRRKLFQSYINDESTWAFRVKAFGKSLPAEEQKSRMNLFSSLFKGTEKVDLQNPDVTLAVVEVG